ncbi:MAG: hypothetical protein M1813_008722 [Trichoglossum hirsutum]|nr:MAG: hypothetical protein M1813_008722 [Trichoglossum hirsutum]
MRPKTKPPTPLQRTNEIPMVSDLPPSRLVYLVCRNIFDGNNATLRRYKSICRLLENKKSMIGQSLLHQYGIERIATVAKALLELRVFQSTLFAQAVFPGLFQTATADNMDQVPYVDTTTPEVHDMEESSILECAPTDWPDTNGSYGGSRVTQPELLTEDQVVVDTDTMSPPQSIHLPYHVQHEITTISQTVLEESCFEFGTTWLPDVMKANGWDCPKSVELIDWTVVLQAHEEQIPADSMTQVAGKPWHLVLAATHGLRHSAVHRRRLSANEIEQLLSEAIKFTTMIGDIGRSTKLVEILKWLKVSTRAPEGKTKRFEKIISSSTCIEAKLTMIQGMIRKAKARDKRVRKRRARRRAAQKTILGGGAPYGEEGGDEKTFVMSVEGQMVAPGKLERG